MATTTVLNPPRPEASLELNRKLVVGIAVTMFIVNFVGLGGRRFSCARSSMRRRFLYICISTAS
jgi:hypothetical protein